MRDLGITLDKVRQVIRSSNTDVGGRTLELSGFEFIVRGKGYLRGTDDIGKIVVKVDNGTPVLLKDVARIELGPDERRGITELNGDGEVASGIALQRSGSNALDVIDNIKQRIATLIPSLPEGTKIVPVYDRSRPDRCRDRHAEAHAPGRERDRGPSSASCFCCTSAARLWRS